MKIEGTKLKIKMIRILKGLNVLLMTAPFAAAWFEYYANRTYSPYYAKGNYLIVALFFIIYAVYAKLYDAYFLWEQQ